MISFRRVVVQKSAKEGEGARRRDAGRDGVFELLDEGIDAMTELRDALRKSVIDTDDGFGRRRTVRTLASGERTTRRALSSRADADDGWSTKTTT
ncbi:MAG: hypothetical protein U0163_00255 [Gemmatimonadaceae bacterium]